MCINEIEWQENITKVKNGNKLNKDMFLDLLWEDHLSLQLPSFENLKLQSRGTTRQLMGSNQKDWCWEVPWYRIQRMQRCHHIIP